jgi:hypothetical protein
MRAGSRKSTRVLRWNQAWRVFIIFVLTTMLVFTAGQAMGSTGTGTVSAVLGSFVEISVLDGSIAPLAATPTPSDPGPRAYSTADGFSFSNGFSNTQALMSMEITSAQDGAASSTKTVQGTVHTIADWIFVLQGGRDNFGTYQVTGTFDADAASYTAPGGFSKDSQGTLEIRYYDKDAPADEGDGNITVYWIYDAGENQYYFDATDKDFTNENGEQLVNPSSKLDAGSGYTYTIAGNEYAVTTVGGVGANYVPTLRMAWQVDFDPLGSVTNDAYLLIDFPSGTPNDTYSITMTTTIAQLTT